MTTKVTTKGFSTLTAVAADYDGGGSEGIYSIQFNPGAAGDILVIKNGADDAAAVCVLASTDGGPRIKYLGGRIAQIYIDFSDCVLSSGHRIDITY